MLPKEGQEERAWAQGSTVDMIAVQPHWAAGPAQVLLLCLICVQHLGWKGSPPLIFYLLSAGAGVAPDTRLVPHTFWGLLHPG